MCFRSGSTSLFFYINQTMLCHLLLTALLLMENRLLTSTRATLLIRIGAYFFLNANLKPYITNSSRKYQL